jgi:hypothetical protein
MGQWLIEDLSVSDVHFQPWMLLLLGIPCVGSSPFGQREVFAKVLGAPRAARIFCTLKAEHLRLVAKLSLARAVKTEEPEVVERLMLRADEYLDQPAALEAAPAGYGSAEAM